MSAAKVLVFRGPLAKRSDAELVAACARGESEALGELFERHADALRASVRLPLGFTESEGLGPEDDFQRARRLENLAPRFRGARRDRGASTSYPRSKRVPSWTSAEGAKPNMALNEAERCAEEAKPARCAASVKERSSDTSRITLANLRQRR